MPQMPVELLKKRLKVQLKDFKSNLGDDVRISGLLDTIKFPLSVTISVLNHSAPVALKEDENTFINGTSHSFKITFPRSYPYQPPHVQWLTPIYHPNIAQPSDGGKVCIKVLENRQLEIDLTGLIRSIVLLLDNPNPSSPLDTPSCTTAAEIMNNCKK